jgi:hypothetical protein
MSLNCEPFRTFLQQPDQYLLFFKQNETMNQFPNDYFQIRICKKNHTCPSLFGHNLTRFFGQFMICLILD